MSQPLALPKRSPAALHLVLCLCLADWLFWQGDSGGFALALYLVILVLTARLAHPSRPDETADSDACLVLALGLLPLLEHLQLLSVIFAVAGAVLAALRLYLGRDGWRLGRALVRLLARVPVLALIDTGRGAADVIDAVSQTRINWRVYILPGVLAVAFASLILLANPVIDAWMSNIRFRGLQVDPGRFWLLLSVALASWPILSLGTHGQALGAPGTRNWQARRPFLSANSVAQALMLFNAMFAVQTWMDMTYLLSPGQLPAGMSYAEYAHRGAYPLIGLALLAGVFMLASTPFLDERRDLKPLLMLWLGQTVFLTMGSAWRLVLYVEAYGLTYLRLRAAVWLLIVAIGLFVLGLQIWHRRTRIWAVLRIALATAVVLYASAFANFAEVIARWNLSDPNIASRDLHYVARLGPMASVPIARFEATHGPREALQYARAPEINDWREWGFRSARINAKLAAIRSETEE